MSRTYKVTGINLKTQAFGEADRLVTILTRECGLLKAIAPGARKPHSSLGGRSGMFIVNELLIAKGKTLDKITQAHTLQTYPGLGKNLVKLAASQYLAEIALCQAIPGHPQEDLYILLNEHLNRLNNVNSHNWCTVLILLVHGIFQLLAIAGLTPQVNHCCLSQQQLKPNFGDADWQVGFSVSAGGIINLAEWKQRRQLATVREGGREYQATTPTVKEENSPYQTIVHQEEVPSLSQRLNAAELHILQHLSFPQILELDLPQDSTWLSVERVLRQYTQYQFGRQIRSATLIDSYFAANL